MCRVRQALLLVLLGLSSVFADSIAVEHSLDGGKTFSPAGAITVRTSRVGATAVLDRDPLPGEQAAQLAELIRADGLYRLRLTDTDVATSFPARCLAAATSPGGLELDVLGGGRVAAISVAAPCSRGAAAAVPELPASQDLRLRLPAAAPDVLPLLAAAGQAAGAQGVPLDASASAVGGQQAGAAAQAGQQQQQGGAQGAAGKKPAEEKTWLQKNWMILAPLSFIVLNIVGSLGAAQQQQQQQRGSSGGGAVRVARR